MVLHGLLNKNNKTMRDDTRASEASNSSSVLYTKESQFPTFAHKKQSALHEKK